MYIERGNVLSYMLNNQLSRYVDTINGLFADSIHGRFRAKYMDAGQSTQFLSFTLNTLIVRSLILFLLNYK